jgi:hypothetical protein
MNPEQAAITLGINVEEVEDLAAAVGADPEDLTPEDLVAMATLLDEEEDDEEDDDDTDE